MQDLNTILKGKNIGSIFETVDKDTTGHLHISFLEVNLLLLRKPNRFSTAHRLRGQGG